MSVDPEVPCFQKFEPPPANDFLLLLQTSSPTAPFPTPLPFTATPTSTRTSSTPSTRRSRPTPSAKSSPSLPSLPLPLPSPAPSTSCSDKTTSSSARVTAPTRPTYPLRSNRLSSPPLRLDRSTTLFPVSATPSTRITTLLLLTNR